MKGMTLPAVLLASSPCSEVGTTPFSWFLSCSLTVRLHETLKQCQNLKTEKNQMDRKISQLSEENGDLSFKVSGAGCAWRPLRAEVLWKFPQEG